VTDNSAVTYCEVHEAKELAQHLNHRTETETRQSVTHVLRQILPTRPHTHTHTFTDS